MVDGAEAVLACIFDLCLEFVHARIACRKAWTGEPFDFRGRTVTVTPRPAQRPGIPIIMGASAEVSSRRAAHLADAFDPSEPRFWEFYRDERIAMGGADPGEWIPPWSDVPLHHP
jgi:Luciferase-like monooxygenase